MNKIAKIAVVASIALAFTACGEDKKKADAEAAVKQQQEADAAKALQDSIANAEKESKRVQDSIAEAEKEAKRVKDSIATADSIAKASKKGAAKAAPAAPKAAAVEAVQQSESQKAAVSAAKDKFKKK
jgi:predicted  nucleic acid-binding Zn-ribbon protein